MYYNGYINYTNKINEGMNPEPIDMCTKSLNNKIKDISILIDYGINVDQINEDDETAFMHACYHNNFEIAKLLISRGADIYQEDSSGETAIDIAHVRGNSRIVKLILISNKYHVKYGMEYLKEWIKVYYENELL